MIQRAGNKNREIDHVKTTRFLWHRLTRTDLEGISAVDADTLKQQLRLKGFDLTRKIEKSTDIDSVYYKQERL